MEICDEDEKKRVNKEKTKREAGWGHFVSKRIRECLRMAAPLFHFLSISNSSIWRDKKKKSWGIDALLPIGRPEGAQYILHVGCFTMQSIPVPAGWRWVSGDDAIETRTAIIILTNVV